MLIPGFRWLSLGSLAVQGVSGENRPARDPSSYRLVSLGDRGAAMKWQAKRWSEKVAVIEYAIPW